MQSIWTEDYNFKQREALNGDIKTDIAIIGAGISGILISFMLKEYGFNSIIIEAKKIASGITKNTTAKITSQHNLIYNKLIKNFGKEKAYQYAQANQLAIEKYEQIINQKNIECEFERKPAYVYSLGETKDIEAEIEAANKLKINAEFTTKVELPFDIKGAVKFNNQAQFNPIKFLKPISDELTIYENTQAQTINEDVIITDRGKIKAKLIIVATHYPFLNAPGYYFMRMYQQRSYIIALENTPQLNGMYIDADSNGYSFRSYNKFLLLGGEGHRTGKNNGDSYLKLRQAAKEFYPASIEKYNWSAQDCITLDGVPYIGHYSNSTHTLYVATGFNKWGMTSSMVSAIIISDMIRGHINKYSDIFDPHRFNITASAKNILENGSEVVSSMIIKKLDIPKENIEHIKNNEGGIIEYEGEKIGVYKDELGEPFFVNTRCTHLGCELKWNPNELSWDCPCHGSRFDYKGFLIDNPAIKNLTD